MMSLYIKAWAQHTPFDSETIKEPVNVDSVMLKAQKRINSEFSTKQRKGSIYYLRYSQADTACSNMRCAMEAIVRAGSCINLHDIEMLTGKIHEAVEDTLEPQSPNWTRNDFIRIIQVAPMMTRDNIWCLARTPFINSSQNSIPVRPRQYVTVRNVRVRVVHEGDVYTEPWEKGFASELRNSMSFLKGKVSERYQASAHVILDSEGDRKIKVKLLSRSPHLLYEEVAGTLYLGEKLNLSCFDGELLGQKLWTMKEGRRNAIRLNCIIHIDYTRERGFDEIKHSRCEIGYGNEKTIIELFKVEGKKLKSKKKVPLDGNLPEAIRQAGYDPELWENEAVKKAIEESTNNYQQ